VLEELLADKTDQIGLTHLTRSIDQQDLVGLFSQELFQTLSIFAFQHNSLFLSGAKIVFFICFTKENTLIPFF
jgi:hypothetical protein